MTGSGYYCTERYIQSLKKSDGELVEVSNPTNLPPPVEIEYIEEPKKSVFKFYHRYVCWGDNVAMSGTSGRV